MATATAGEQINGALRLLGVLAEGEVPSADTAQDALTTLNQMIDSWSIESLSIFSTLDQTFSWPSNTISATLGPTGDFVGVRPTLLNTATYFVDPDSNLSFGVRFINEDQYNGIALKDITSTYPQVIWVNMEYPNISMKIFPEPTKVLEWHFISNKELTEASTLYTDLSFPPGYLRAFKYNLACELAAEFGVEPSPQVQRIAMTSKRNLKRINNPDYLMSMPYGLVYNRPRFNVYTGNF